MRLWRRRPAAVHRWSPPDPIPDNDQVLSPGQRRWADLIGEQAAAAFSEPTMELPVVPHAPLLTQAQRWRSRRGRRR